MLCACVFQLTVRKFDSPNSATAVPPIKGGKAAERPIKSKQDAHAADPHLQVLHYMT